MTALNGAYLLGQGGNRQRLVDSLIGEPLTEGYRPTLPLWMLESDWVPQIYLLRDIEIMMTHPVVYNCLNYFKSGIASVDFELAEETTPDCADFVMKQTRRYWDRGVPAIQGGYEYGWIGLESLYCEEEGRLSWRDVDQFCPRDAFLLTRDKRKVGVRIKNIDKPQHPHVSEVQLAGSGESADKSGTVDLWFGTKDVPAKALWYAHEPRYQSHYGRSQLLAAWRPWRRLAWKDSAETVADTGVYRFAYCGPMVYHPDEDYQVGPTAGTPNTTPDSQGRPRRYARDIARQMAEFAKAGAGIGIPSENYPAEFGGGPKWKVEWPKSTLNIDGLINYIKHLWGQISYGVGVPPELIDAPESGSGYSGRKIPREAFLMRQQRIAVALLDLFVEQVLTPLVRWNFGDKAKFGISVKNILATERAAATGQEPGKGTPPKDQQGLPQQSPTAGRPPGWHEARGIDNVPQPQHGPEGGFSLAVRSRIEAIKEVVRRRRAA